MSATDIERGWMNISEAAQYLGLAPDLIRQAALSGDIEAHEKPVTRGRTATGDRKNLFMKISRDDLDAWVRSWPRVGGDHDGEHI